MVCGRFPCLPCKCILLLLILFFHDVDSARCREGITLKVGETAEFSVAGCVLGGNVITAKWKFGNDQVIIEKDENGTIPSDNPQFKDRVTMNPHNFSLTITRLTRNDSGKYSFVSGTDEQQNPTMIITLDVYDCISKEPHVTVIWHAENNSCLVSLECRATSADNITYTWTVGNKTKGGHKVNVHLWAEERDATVTCTVTNGICQQSASKTVSCKPSPVINSTTGSEPNQLFVVATTAGTVGLLLAVALSVACYCIQKSAGTNGPESPDTIYATVSDDQMRSNTLVNQNRIYESIEDRINLVTVGTHSVYDKINFNRPLVASTSSIPDVCQTPNYQLTSRP